MDEVKQARNDDAVAAALMRVRSAAADPDVSLMRTFLEAAQVYATLGEIVAALQDVLGTWVEKPSV